MNTWLNVRNDKLNIFLTISLFLLLLVNTFVRSQFDTLITIGEVTTDVTLFFMFSLLIYTFIKHPAKDTPFTALYLIIALMFILFVVSFLTTDYMERRYELGQLLLLLLFIVSSARFQWREQGMRIAEYIFGLATLCFFVHWIVVGLPLFGFKSIYRNENYLGVLLFSFFFFHVISFRFSNYKERLFFLFVLIINLTLLVATSARSVLIALFCIFVAWIVLTYYQRLFKWLIYVALATNFFFIGFYVLLSRIQLGVLLNEWSRALFNKNLFSGRTEIWVKVVKAVLQEPLFGYGIGVKARYVVDTHLTTHNMYLQLLLEFGIIGFGLFVLLLVTIWRLLMGRLHYFVGKWSSCFMLGLLMYLSFEMTLFQNNYSIAFFQWIIMTMGISFIEHPTDGGAGGSFGE